MKLDAHLEIVNNLAIGYKGSRSCLSKLSLAKVQDSTQYFLITNNTKKPSAEKYKLFNNVERIYSKFVNEGKATIALKEPNINLVLQKANVSQLKSFLKLLHLAANSSNFRDELSNFEKIDPDSNANGQLKKQISSMTIKSKSEYNSNFRAIISQNLSVKSSMDTKNSTTAYLSKLTINNCDLIQINSSIFQLEHLVYLDLCDNKLTHLDNFHFETLQELHLSNNKIKTIGKNCFLPKLSVLEINNNFLTSIDNNFCKNFKNLTRLSANSNTIKAIVHNFGYNMLRLKNLDLSNNKLDILPYSLSYLKLEMIELQKNPFEFTSNITKIKKPHFPTLVEICARNIINTKIKYSPLEIPRSLVEYMNGYFKCICGRSCFEHRFKMITMYVISQFSQAYICISINGFDNQIPMEINLCSFKCYIRNQKFFKYQFLTESNR